MDNTGAVLSQEVIDAARAELGLDRPFLEQYVPLGWAAYCTATWAPAMSPAGDVSAAFAAKLPATLLLTAVPSGLRVAVSVPLGVLAAVCRGRPMDWLLRAASFAGGSMPNFFVALLLMYLFSIKLGWAAGDRPPAPTCKACCCRR